MEPTRRDVLGACGTAATAGIAGCSGGMPVIGGGDGAESGRFLGWLGPEMADVQWVTYPDTDVDFVLGVEGVSPSTALSSDINDDLAATWRDQNRGVTTQTGTFEFDPEEVEAAVYDPMRTFHVATGDLPTDEYEEALSEGATDHGTHRGRRVYAGEATHNEGTERETTYYEGFGVGSDTLAVAYAAPDADSAAEFVRSLLDTKAGDDPQFADSDDRFAAVADLLDPELFVACSNLGHEIPTGVSLSMAGGDAVKRVAAEYVPGDVSERADSFRAQVRARDSETDREDDLRVGEKFVAYEDYEVRTTEHCVVFEGTVPASELAVVDLKWP